jgi:hypothetical protein
MRVNKVRIWLKKVWITEKDIISKIKEFPSGWKIRNLAVGEVGRNIYNKKKSSSNWEDELDNKIINL